VEGFHTLLDLVVGIRIVAAQDLRASWSESSTTCRLHSPAGALPQKGTQPPDLRMAMERRVCGPPMQQRSAAMPHIFHGEIANERDPNREEGHNHKANRRNNEYGQVHGSPPDAWLG